MTYFADLTPCTYFNSGSEDWSSSLRAIGWLEPTHGFTTGPVAPDARMRLASLIERAWQPVLIMGYDTCSFCVRDRGLNPSQHYADASAAANLFVPGAGCVYVAPALLLHYIDAHAYQPPAEFLQAVMRCPRPDSADYLAALEQSASPPFRDAIRPPGERPKATDELRFDAAYLDVMREPPLAPSSGPRSECYRVLRVPSFRPKRCVRIERTSDVVTVTAKEWAGLPVAGRGELVFETSRTLPPAQAASVWQRLSTGFWAVPDGGGHLALDGETVILEGRRGADYRAIVCLNPSSSGQDAPFRALCDFMDTMAPKYVPPPPTAAELKARADALRVQQEADDAKERERAEAVRRSNQLAQRLANDEATKRRLRCPHCHTGDLRFVARNPSAAYYFVCRSCGRSMAPEEVDLARG